jgi:membrane protein DedA with SNARE-associated domain
MLPLHTVVQLLEHYGYILLFVIAVIEGPIITIVGAFLAGLGYFNIFAVFAVVSAGDLFGDILYYALGRLGTINALAGLRRALGITTERLAQMKQYIERHGAKILLFAKFTQTGILALPASGAARMPFGQFLWINILGTLPKSLVLVLVGFFFGYAYERIDGYFAKASLVIAGLVCIAGAYALLSRYLRTVNGER